MRDYDAMYEVWCTRGGGRWEFEAGSGTFEGAMQCAGYLEDSRRVSRVRVFLRDVVSYDSVWDKGRQP